MKRTYGIIGRAISGTALIMMISMAILASPGNATPFRFDGNLKVDSWLGESEPCQFTMDVNGTPGGTGYATLNASTFSGAYWGDNPCEWGEPQITSNVVMHWSGTNTSAVAAPFTVSVPDPTSPCTYTLSGSMSMTSSWDSLAAWAGSQSATSAVFPCFFTPATVTIFDGEFY